MATLALALLLISLSALSGCGPRPRDAAPAPTLAVAVTVEGRSATVRLETTGLDMGGAHHPHLTLNGGPEVMLFTSEYTFRDLPPGEHAVHVRIDDERHVATGLEETVRFTVE